MYDVVIECSRTGRLVSTGVIVDPAQDNALPSTSTELSRCQACGHPHTWSRWTAILTAARTIA